MNLAYAAVTATVALGLGGLALAQTPSTAPAAAKKTTRALATMRPAAGSTAEGTVTFTAVAGGGVAVKASLRGLGPGTHGFHPKGSPHGAPTDAARHAGDLGNVQAAADGTASLEWTDPAMTLEGPDSVVGHAVVIHANPDDLKTQPTGNAGGRVACGVIGIAKGE
jgi:Cu-Zn family superoxide dismutase